MKSRTVLLQTALTAAVLSLLPTAQAYDFGAWPEHASPQEVGHRVAERFVESPHGNGGSRQPKYIVYPETCAWYGALTFAKVTNDAPLRDALIRRFEPLFGPEANLVPAPVHVDLSVFGAVPLELYLETKEPRYRDLGLRSADAEWAPQSPETLAKLTPELRATAEEATKVGLSWQTRFWVDDMYMITILQVQAYRATGEQKYLDRAAKEAVAYLDRLQQPNGLFYHAPDVPYFWGRGDGWFAVGMSELLSSMPENHPLRGRILDGYHKMMATLLKEQDAGGMWHQLIDHPEAWPETSCTGMFTFAFISGVQHGWLDPEKYGPAAKKGWLALVRHLNADAAITDVCEGTNKKNDYQYYLDRKRNTGDLHGQAPVLWCATALLR